MSKTAATHCDREGCEEFVETEPVTFGGAGMRDWLCLTFSGYRYEFCSIECLAEWAKSTLPTVLGE